MNTYVDNKDPINFFSQSDVQLFGKTLSDKSIPELLEIKKSAGIITGQFTTVAHSTKPIPISMYNSSSTTKIDILNVKRSVNGVNYIAQKAAEQGRKEAQTILEKFSQNYYGDKIIRDISGLNPINSIENYKKFEETKSTQILDAERFAQNDAQFEALKDRVGTTTPDPNNVPIYDKNNYGSKFNKDGSITIGGFKTNNMQILKSCFPCEFRRLDFTAEYSTPWTATMEDMKKKWLDLLKMMRDIEFGGAKEFSTDLCNLFKFLDGQCIPDITGLMSLLSIMKLKYMDLSLTSLQNIIGQLIGPFLTPVVGNFVSNLNQYSELIIGPLRCIVRSLEQNITTLQDQLNGAYNIADMNTTKFRMKEIEFYDAKIKSLRNRKIQIEKEKRDKLVRANGLDPNVANLDGKVLIQRKNTEYSDKKETDLTRPDKLIETKLVNGGGFRFSRIAKDYNQDALTYDQELRNIDAEIEKINEKKQKIRTDISKDNNYVPVNFDGAISVSRQTRFALDNMEKSYRSLIGELTGAVNDGINVIKQAIDLYREELQRIVLGRVSTQQDQLEYARLIQGIIRLSSVISTVYDMKNMGNNLKKFCEKGPHTALGQIAKGIKQNSPSDLFDFYNAVNAEGQPLMVIAPAGAKLSVTGIEFNNDETDELFADGRIDLDSVTKTTSFNDLGEVDRLNREGVAPDLGNIDSKKIEISTDLRTGSELDLHFRNSYAIISNDFCSKSAINFGSSESVKKWAEGLWQKN